jgi:hypothetical protein
MEPAKPDGARGEAEGWLLLLAQLPTDDPATRMRVLRTLESLGAAMMREGVYLMPESADNRKALDALGDYVSKGGGSGQVLHAEAIAPEQQQTLKRLFDRSGRYEALIKTVESLRVGFGQSDPSAIARVLHKQRRELESIAALDFFPSETQKRAQAALAESETAVHKLMFSARARAALGPDENLRGRTWATRKPVWADRLACAWLIRRFIDPEASLLWLEKGQALIDGAVGFGFDGAHFANSATRITYEEMLARFELGQNAALSKVGSIVRFLESGGTTVPEAAGVQTLLQGALRRSTGDYELLGEAEKTFDLLYEAYFEPEKR